MSVRVETESHAFDRRDKAVMAAIALAWGSSFLWISVALTGFSPHTVAFGRVVLGAGALGVSASARRAVPRSAWLRIAVVGVVGNAAPALLFATAQQTVASSVAGVINAVTPLAVLAVGAALFGRRPTRREIVGLVVGFVRATIMASAAASGASADHRGVVMLFAAVLCYGVANNVVVDLQRAYGSVAVMARALFVASLVLAPLGGPGFVSSTAGWWSWSALTILGVIGTGGARSLSAWLAGRRGASRAAVVTYLAPVIAVALGIFFLDESVSGGGLLGVAVVLLAAAVISR